MLTFPKKIAPPSDDKRWRLVDATMRRHGHAPNSLIETLHTVQEAFGYLDQDALRYVSASLRVPPSKVYGVATFYHFFTLRPPGAHTCVVCTGTACYIKGAPVLLKTIRDELGIQQGETTPDGKISVLTARCLGSCGLAPAAVFDGQVAGKMTSLAMAGKLKELEK
ncbi:bidirectional hydrogenase complex protein HoxE [Anaerolineae bacterium CFX7]|nr:bidirectional hydrogenase complex protein HoxE [Anaerolineae bacterium CFX7]RIK22077.1 MAG: hydrogenase HoxE [Chloroflexota bacterium]